jgi:salicylate hydroxylase
LTPNSTKLLQRWGLGDTLENLAASPEVFTISRYTGLRILGRRDGFGREMLQKYGSPFCDIHRADLQLAMFERAKQLGVGFMFDALVTKYDLESPSVTLSNGDQIDGDLIVAADGKILDFSLFWPGVQLVRGKFRF